MNTIERKMAAAILRFEAVSYTHLDVYKRQQDHYPGMRRDRDDALALFQGHAVNQRIIHHGGMRERCV